MPNVLTQARADASDGAHRGFVTWKRVGSPGRLSVWRRYANSGAKRDLAPRTPSAAADAAAMAEACLCTSATPGRGNLDAQRHLEGVVVAATGSQVAAADDRRAIAEDIVDAAEGTARVHPVHPAVEVLQSLRLRAGVEVAHENDGIPGTSLAGDDLQHVVCRRLAAAAAASAHGQGPVVVDEEERAVGDLVLQANPHHRPGAVPLVVAVLADVLSAIGKQGPAGLPEGHAHGVGAHESAVLADQATILHDLSDALALLETQHVELRRRGGLGDEPPGAAAVAPADAEEVPPEEVVG
mmetsp:Transcript_104769/g.301208  ORF Transcript_104769/g.301208 Transcript_104769/m.301208 type:complete len:297 (-) Transcript_104769:648-1538(-)